MPSIEVDGVTQYQIVLRSSIDINKNNSKWGVPVRYSNSIHDCCTNVLINKKCVSQNCCNNNFCTGSTRVSEGGFGYIW